MFVWLYMFMWFHVFVSLNEFVWLFLFMLGSICVCVCLCMRLRMFVGVYAFVCVSVCVQVCHQNIQFMLRQIFYIFEKWNVVYYKHIQTGTQTKQTHTHTGTRICTRTYAHTRTSTYTHRYVPTVSPLPARAIPRTYAHTPKNKTHILTCARTTNVRTTNKYEHKKHRITYTAGITRPLSTNLMVPKILACTKMQTH